MNPKRPKLIPALLISAVLMAIGGVIGFLARPLILPSPGPVAAADEQSVGDGHGDHGADGANDGHAGDAGHGSASIVELNETTVANMNLTTGKFEQRDYMRHIIIPAEVVEYVPQGRQSVVAPLAGRVAKVYITRGEAIRPGQKLFDWQVTDTSMSEAQLNLMSVVSEIESQQKRLNRLRPLADKGAIAGKQVIELELKIEQLNRRQASLTEEIGIRGVDANDLKTAIAEKKFNRTVEVFAPEIGDLPGVEEGPSLEPGSASLDAGSENWFTVESIFAEQGQAFPRGERLCSLTWHGKLLVKGRAFESDMPAIAAAGDAGWSFAAEFGEVPHRVRREELPLFSIDSHVDKDSQTFPVYVAIDNEVSSRHQDSDDRWHVNWRFKPGQRAHLEIPVERWSQQVVAPAAAVVTDGPETFVFKKMDHTHESDDGSVIVEFEKIPVKILHQDTRHVVLQDQLKLDLYERYALEKAHQLNLALKQAASGGGGGHSHHGHSH